MTENKPTFHLALIKLYIFLFVQDFFFSFFGLPGLFVFKQFVFKSFNPAASIRINLALSHKTASKEELFLGESRGVIPWTIIYYIRDSYLSHCRYLKVP